MRQVSEYDLKGENKASINFFLVGMPPPQREWVPVEGDTGEDDSGSHKLEKDRVSRKVVTNVK